jgi:urease accessory protein
MLSRNCEIQPEGPLTVTQVHIREVRIMSKLSVQKFSLPVSTLSAGLGALLLAIPASAHHVIGGRMPANFFEGFLSGLAHPVLGPDHFAFVVGAGLLAATKRQGIWIPVAFVLAALAGTGLHLNSLDFPGAELWIAASVLVFGILLALPNSPNLLLMMGLGAIAGIFHGYAYGEAIVGANMNPLIAYLAGFTLIQLTVALMAYKVGRWTLQQLENATSLPLRFAGFTLCGLGMAFVVSRLGL